MVGYKHPCRYCEQFIPPNSNVCPLCGKINPLGPLRCPQCRNPVRRNWQKCSNCGLELGIDCPHCGEKTFFADYCDSCSAALTVVCPHEKCRAVQPPLGKKCRECGKSLQG